MREFITPTTLTPPMAFFEMWMTYWAEFWLEGTSQAMQMACAPICAPTATTSVNPYQLFVPMPFRDDEEQDLFA